MMINGDENGTSPVDREAFVSDIDRVIARGNYLVLAESYRAVKFALVIYLLSLGIVMTSSGIGVPYTYMRVAFPVLIVILATIAITHLVLAIRCTILVDELRGVDSWSLTTGVMYGIILAVLLVPGINVALAILLSWLAANRLHTQGYSWGILGPKADDMVGTDPFSDEEG